MNLGKIEDANSRCAGSGTATPTSTHGSNSPAVHSIGIKGEKHHTREGNTQIEALQLAEDMNRIEQALFAVQRIAPESINKDRDKAWRDRNDVIMALKCWHAFSRERLRTEYLCS